MRIDGATRVPRDAFGRAGIPAARAAVRALALVGALAVAASARGACALFAETAPSAEVYLSLAESVDAKGVDPIESGTVAGARFSLDSARGESLKGSARVSLDSSAGLTLDRAYLKARLLRGSGGAALRLTLGKAPLSWGKGFLFNAGDPIFGAAPRVTALSDDEYRTATAWMLGAYVPLGAFSFAEAVALPRVDAGGAERGAANGEQETENSLARAVAGSENPDTRAGCRALVTPGWGALQSAEAGFLASDAGPLSAYAAFDGSLVADWYCALSARWDSVSADPRMPEFALSFGLFRVFGVIPGMRLTARAESLVYPPANRALWYPELALGLTDGLSVFARGILATGRRVARIADDAASGDAVGNAAGALDALPWLDSGSAIASIGFSWALLNDITLSGSALWRLGKGDGEPMGQGLTVQTGFTCAF